MKVVITGASGFLGSETFKESLGAGLDVVGVSRSISGHVQVRDYCDTPSGDVLIHLAENSDRSYVNERGLAYYDEAMGNLDVLISKNYNKIIYASSATLYGDDHTESVGEEGQVFENDIYGKIKLASEKRVLAAGGIVARLTNIYGFGMSRKNVMSDILEQLKGDEIVLLKKLYPIRDFIHVSDAARALVALAMIKDFTGIVNVGTGRGVSIKELAEIFRDCSNKETLEIKQIDILENRSRSSLVLKVDKLMRVASWTPKVEIEQGVRQLINAMLR